MKSRLRGLGARAARGPLTSASARSPDSEWFWDHYESAAGEIVSFAASCGLSLEGLDIADVGCGDGIMALGLHTAAGPRRLVAVDVVPTNAETLLERARAEGVLTGGALPDTLEFRQSTAETIAAADGEFDFVYSWSAFEHIETPIEVLREIRRSLRPTGHFFLQLWPFYHSAKGSHLWDWFLEDFHHLTENDRDIVAKLEQSDRHTPEVTRYMTREFEHLNRITLDELQRAVLAADFDVRRVELLPSPAIITPVLARYSWTDLAIGGIKLLAAPRP